MVMQGKLALVAGAGAGLGQDGRRRRIRSDHQMPRRTEYRKQRRRNKQCVETGDDRRAGDIGVAENLRDRQRRQGDPGDDFGRYPAPVERQDTGKGVQWSQDTAHARIRFLLLTPTDFHTVTWPLTVPACSSFGCNPGISSNERDKPPSLNASNAVFNRFVSFQYVADMHQWPFSRSWYIFVIVASFRSPYCRPRQLTDSILLMNK